jgi:hypothetical protein
VVELDDIYSIFFFIGHGKVGMFSHFFFGGGFALVRGAS